jgi:Mg/Co/Ni transporter MgtE
MKSPKNTPKAIRVGFGAGICAGVILLALASYLSPTWTFSVADVFALLFFGIVGVILSLLWDYLFIK